MSEDANYSWRCPYCDKEGFTKWNKSCFYQIVDHCKKEHLDLTFTRITERHTFKGKEKMLDNNWGFFNSCVKTITEK